MVMEICANGSLYDCMQDNTFYFDWNLFFKMALDMTKGLHTLHNWVPPVVHRDFKSPNLLVDENNNIKVDFLKSSKQSYPILDLVVLQPILQEKL